MSISKIDSVFLYTGGINSSNADISVRQALTKANISFSELGYHDSTQIPGVLAALSTWHWGKDKHRRPFTTFPIVTWKEYYTDLHQMDFNAVGLIELKSSSLITNANVVVKI